jgi:hypothetical protein
MTKVVLGFPQSLHGNADRVLQLGHESFLPNPLQFTGHSSVVLLSYPTLCSVDTASGVQVTARNAETANGNCRSRRRYDENEILINTEGRR